MGCTVQRNLQNLREPMFKSYALPSQPNKGIIPAGASVVGTRVAAAAAALECARSKLNLSIHFLARTVRRSVGPSVGRAAKRDGMAREKSADVAVGPKWRHIGLSLHSALQTFSIFTLSVSHMYSVQKNPFKQYIWTSK